MNSKIACFAISVLALVTPAFAGGVDLPVEGLKNRIDFWKKVYTVYGANDLVIHDRLHVNLIYDVASDAEVDAKLRDVRIALEEIRSNLDVPESLSAPAQQIYSAIVGEGLSVSAPLLDELSENIHTQRGIKERFRDGVIRSGRYVEQFQSIFEDHGLPTELALLPLVESSFTNARSKAGAVGVWQFTRGTGRLYMKVSGKVDERLDPIKSARAAARLLKDNYSALQVWPLAITAYNHGRGGMLRAQSQHGSDITTIIKKYDGAAFGYASMNFYTEFLAAVEVYQNYPQYFGELVLDSPGGPVTKSLAVAKAQTPKATKRKNGVATAKVVADKYKVRNGDTLSVLARRFGTTIRGLMEKNDLRKPAIYAGQILLVN